MNWKDHYQSRTVEPAQAAAVIKSDNRVIVAHGCGAPRSIIKAMVERAPELERVEVAHMLTLDECLYAQPQYEKSFRVNALFAGPSTREALAQGRGDHTPVFFKDIPSLFRPGGTLPVDVALISVSEPDAEGYVNLGVAVDYTKEAATQAKVVLAEVNPHMPRVGGDARMHSKDIDWFVKTDRPLAELAPTKIGPVEQSIGRNIASLVKDGDCLQLGIGAIPDAVLEFLGDKKDLGIHTELVSDGVMKLAERGVVTGARKSYKPGKILITFAMGTAAFYKWLDNNPMIEAAPVDVTNDPYIIAKNDNFISINSCLSVDMLGQVASDTIGTRQYSGIGGQVDFIRGAAMSKGGLSILAMPSTAAKGTVSRICTTLDPGQAVTTSRCDVDYVVTEHGIAALKGKTVRQRSDALINIAAPEFREQLREARRATFGW